MKKLIFFLLLLPIGLFGQVVTSTVYFPSVSTPASNDYLTNLVAYWALEEASGTLDDAVGANNSTSCAADYGSTGKVGDCLLFVAANSDYVQIADAAALQMYDQDFTMAAWINMTDLPASGADEYFIGGENSSAGISAYNNTTNTVIRANWIANQNATASTATISAGTWYFVAVVFDSNATTNNLTYYVNSSTNVVTFNYDFSDGAGTNVLGSRRSSTNFFDGLLDEVMIWKGRKLTEANLDDIYNSGNGRAFSYFQ